MALKRVAGRRVLQLDLHAVLTISRFPESQLGNLAVGYSDVERFSVRIPRRGGPFLLEKVGITHDATARIHVSFGATFPPWNVRDVVWVISDQ